MRSKIGEGRFLLAEGEDLRTYGKSILGDDLLQIKICVIDPHGFTKARDGVLRELAGPMGRIVK